MQNQSKDTVTKFIEYFESPSNVAGIFQDLLKAMLNNTIANDWPPSKRVKMTQATFWLNSLSFAAFTTPNINHDDLINNFVFHYGTRDVVTDILFEILETAMISGTANTWKEEKRSDMIFFSSWLNKLVTVAFLEKSFNADQNTSH